MLVITTESGSFYTLTDGILVRHSTSDIAHARSAAQAWSVGHDVAYPQVGQRWEFSGWPGELRYGWSPFCARGNDTILTSRVTHVTGTDGPGAWLPLDYDERDHQVWDGECALPVWHKGRIVVRSARYDYRDAIVGWTYHEIPPAQQYGQRATRFAHDRIAMRQMFAHAAGQVIDQALAPEPF